MTRPVGDTPAFVRPYQLVDIRREAIWSLERDRTVVGKAFLDIDRDIRCRVYVVFVDDIDDRVGQHMADGRVSQPAERLAHGFAAVQIETHHLSVNVRRKQIDCVVVVALVHQVIILP